MKKIIFLLPFLLVISCVLTGCSNNNYLVAANNIAEIRKELYVGEAENISSTYICGEREVEYSMNGKATPLIEFGVLTFFTNAELTTVPTYTLVVGDKTFSGALEKNPFDGSYVVDIGECISSENMVATFITPDMSTEIVLSKVNDDWEIDAMGALETYCKKMGSSFDKFMKDEAFIGECYIKIVNDSEISPGKYFWYVNIINDKGNSFSAIIEPHTGDILAKKSS